METTGRLSNGDVAKFLFAGNATFTLRSTKTGARYTYRVQVPQHPDPARGEVHFVKVLTGPDNTADFQFFGTIFDRSRFQFSVRKSRIGREAPSVKAFEWFFDRLRLDRSLPDGLEVYHEGRCGRCGRVLTVPESILTGFGPECSELLGVSRAEAPVPPPVPAPEDGPAAQDAIKAQLTGPARKAHRENSRRLAERPEQRVETGETYGEWSAREAQEVGL